MTTDEQLELSELNEIDDDAHTSSTQIRDLFLKEVSAMIRYAISSGLDSVPNQVFSIAESFSVEYEQRERDRALLKERYVFDENKALDLRQLVEAHDMLSKSVYPATPRAILLLDPVFAKKSWFSWLSHVALLRRLMLVAFCSLQ